MDHAAIALMREFPEIILGFGQSDEYRYLSPTRDMPNTTIHLPGSFLFRKSAVLYNRRRSKITSILCSYFTASYVMNWNTYFPETTLRYVPSFDARIVLYPGSREVRDYFSWRQADSASHPFCARGRRFDPLSAHINNLYNTTFWALIHQGGLSKKDANEALRVCFA
jgi:tRNA(His) guanylyltransferase